MKALSMLYIEFWIKRDIVVPCELVSSTIGEALRPYYARIVLWHEPPASSSHPRDVVHSIKCGRAS